MFKSDLYIDICGHALFQNLKYKPQKKEKLLETYRGVIDSIEGDTIYVTNTSLKDGYRISGTSSRKDFKNFKNIKVGMKFKVNVFEVSESVCRIEYCPPQKRKS
jgi:hypothetical protein